MLNSTVLSNNNFQSNRQSFKQKYKHFKILSLHSLSQTPEQQRDQVDSGLQQLWNSLPLAITETDNTGSFKSALITDLCVLQYTMEQVHFGNRSYKNYLLLF